MAHQHTGKISLCSGQSLSLRMAGGTTVAAIAGKIRISGAPRWLAGQVIAQRIDLAEGSSHVIQDAGWITLTALTAAEAAWVKEEKEGWLARLWQGIALIRRRAPLPGLRQG